MRLTDKDSLAKERVNMQAGEGIIGIDISKDSFDVVLRGTGSEQHRVFSNDQKGFKTLVGWAEKQPERVAHICMEATGSYWEGLAEYLYQGGYTVSVVNPYQIKRYGDHLLNRNKTDKADASLIAEFCEKDRERLRAWKPFSPQIKALRSMGRRLDELQGMKQQEQNRLKSGVTDPVVIESLQENLKQLKDQIKVLWKKIKEYVNQHPDLREQQRLLTSIPGIGKLTAIKLIAEIGDIKDFDDASQLAAYAGLAPKEFRSGSSVHKQTHISKQGRTELRQCLYMPAVVASEHNPIVMDLKRRMLASGHVMMEVIVAAMKKLLHLVYGVLKSGKPFDPDYGKQFR